MAVYLEPFNKRSYYNYMRKVKGDLKAISIRVEKDLYDWVVREAEINGRPINSQVWYTLEKGIKWVEMEKKKLKELEEEHCTKPTQTENSAI